MSPTSALGLPGELAGLHVARYLFQVFLVRKDLEVGGDGLGKRRKLRSR